MFAFRSVSLCLREVSSVEYRHFLSLFGLWSIWALLDRRSRGVGSALFLPWFRQDGGTEATTWDDFVTEIIVMQVIGILLLWLLLV